MTILDSPSRGKRDWSNTWFAIVPATATINKKLSNGAVRCLGVMASFSNKIDQDPRNITRVCATPQATLANKLDVPVGALLVWNNMTLKKRIYPGDRLKVGTKP